VGLIFSTLFLGAVVGSIYSLYAFGLVVTYRTSGVFNFAQGAMGMFFAFVFFQLTQGGTMDLVLGDYTQKWKLPVPVALPLVVLVLAPAMGGLLDVVLFRKLRTAGSVVQIVATIGLLISLVGVAGVIWTEATSLTPRAVISGGELTAGNFRANVQQITTILIVIGLCVALLAFLRFSSLGVRMRAVVDRADLAQAMGVDAGRVAAQAWGISSGFAALAGILVAPFYGTLDITTLSLLVVGATAAAVIGKLENLPFTLVGGMGVGIGELLVQRYVHGNLATQLRPSVPFLVLFGVLLLPVRWPEPAFATLPKSMPPVVSTRRATITKFAILAAVVVIPPFLATHALSKLLGIEWQGQLALIPGTALIFLSLVLVTGYAGHISLCQGALAGIGAFEAAHLMVDHHVPFYAAAFLGALLPVIGGAVLASPAARLPPLFLGLATLAFGAFADQFIFTSQWFSNGTAGYQLQRPELLRSDRVFFFVGLAVFAVFAFLATNLRRRRTGRALAAMRDSPLGLTSLGENTTRLKFVIFCVSAFAAGVGGAFLAEARNLTTASDFLTLQSFIFLALVVIGGISRWPGALLSAALFVLSPAIFHQPVFSQNIVFKTLFHGQLEPLLPAFFGMGAIGLARNPYGLIEQFRSDFGEMRRKRRERATAAPGATRRAGGHAGETVPGLVVLPNANLYHDRRCMLARGKEGRSVTGPIDEALRPCPVCSPVAALPTLVEQGG